MSNDTPKYLQSAPVGLVAVGFDVKSDAGSGLEYSSRLSTINTELCISSHK